LLGSALAHNGNAAEAVPLLEKGFADRIHLASPYGRIFMRVGLGVAYRNLGKLEDAIRAGREAVEQSGEQYGHRTEALYALAETLRRAGDVSGAEDCFRQTYEAARRLGMPYYQKRATAALARQHEDWQA
jgi:tetratricopeptide (TPR) repeat protein